MATLPEAIAAGTVTQDTNPANSLYSYWTDGVSDLWVTIEDLLKNPGAIGSGTPSSGAFTTLSSTGVASLDSLALTTDLAVAHGGTGASTAAGARSNLGLVIGTNVQAYDAGLQSIAGLTTAADRMIYTTASDTYAVATLTAFARSILDDADAATVRATLDVDQAGTDNSTDVTLAGAFNYLTIAGQEITLNQIDLTTDVTGNLPAANAAFTDQNVLTTSSPTFANVGLSTGGALRAGTSATNTLLLQAYDVDGAAYTTFLTLTSGNTPTADLAASVTIDGNAILDSTWAGSSNITTLGTIGAGTWQGTAIANAYVAGLDQNVLTTSSPTFAGLTVTGLSSLNGYATSGSLTRSVSIAPDIVVPENGTSAGIYSFPAFSTSATGTHALIAGTYLKTPTITDNGAAITDAATLYIEGMPTSGASTNLALFIGSGNSRIRDKLGVGAVTLPDATLTVYGPGDTNYTAKFRTSNVAAPYGVAVEEVSGGASGYPLFVVASSGFSSEWFSVTSGTGLTKIRTAQVGISSFGSADTHTVYGGTLFSLASGSAHIHLQRTGTSSGDAYIGSAAGDVRFGTSAGGSEIAQFGASSATIASDLTLASGSITSASGAISFGNENLSTTGTLASGNATVTGTLGVTDNVTVTRSSPNLYLRDTGTNFATIRFYTSTSTERVTLRGNAAGSFIVETGGPSPVTALTLDSSQNATFAGDLTLSAGDLEVTTGLGRFGGSTDPASMTTGVVLYNGTAPSAGAANAIALYSKDLSAGNTMLGIYTEGSPVGTGTPTQDRTVAVEVNGTTLYLLASTAAS